MDLVIETALLTPHDTNEIVQLSFNPTRTAFPLLDGRRQAAIQYQ